eukprot:1045937-Pelagomonas_calceolata.AAC.1
MHGLHQQPSCYSRLVCASPEQLHGGLHQNLSCVLISHGPIGREEIGLCAQLHIFNLTSIEAAPVVPAPAFLPISLSTSLCWCPSQDHCTQKASTRASSRKSGGLKLLTLLT